jgi:hypothetical protein
MFLPQVVLAIAASLLGSALARAITLKRVLLLGLAAFGVGPILDAGQSLSDVFRVTAVAAAVLGLVSFAVAGPRALSATSAIRSVREPS